MDLHSLIWKSGVHDEKKIANLINNADMNSINSLDEKQRTPLMIACKVKSSCIAEALIKRKCNLKHINHKGNTALMIALKNMLIGIAELILDSKEDCNINQQNRKGKTALLLAVYTSNDALTLKIIKNNVSKKLIYETSIDILDFNLIVSLNYILRNNTDGLIYQLHILNELVCKLGQSFLFDRNKNNTILTIINYLMNKYDNRWFFLYKNNIINLFIKRIYHKMTFSANTTTPQEYEYSLKYKLYKILIIKLEELGLEQSISHKCTLFDMSNMTILDAAIKSKSIWIVEDLLRRYYNKDKCYDYKNEQINDIIEVINYNTKKYLDEQLNSHESNIKDYNVNAIIYDYLID
jgi:hypothetical protein